jgi:endonuclease/exonuclease/phosphatase (EEP) superfamily protein YafD
MRLTARRALVAAWSSYLAGLVAACILVQLATDTWWPATLVAFGPRWIVLVPALAASLILLLERRLRWTLAVPAISAIVLLNPSIGGLWPWTGDAKGRVLRVVTHNVGGGRVDSIQLATWLRAVEPDVVVLQECSDATVSILVGVAKWKWTVNRNAGLCLASRFPVGQTVAVDRRPLGGWGNIAVRHDVQVGSVSIALLNVHLETPRPGIEAMMTNLWRGRDEMRQLTSVRSLESSLALNLLGHAAVGPAIVAGDFNMPVESAIYRENWSGFVNAFSKVGLGLGHTKTTRWFGTRIDHVLTGTSFRPVRCWVGPEMGNDHRPVVADVEFLG